MKHNEHKGHRIHHPSAEDARSERIALHMSQSEVKAIDDVRFARRLNSRAEAIRFLVEQGLARVAEADGQSA